MPELPEVQTVVSTLQPRLLGRRVASVHLRLAKILTPPDANLANLLTGRTIAAIGRRGKRIVFILDDQSRFYIHLGMTGRLTVEPPDAPLLPHTHLILAVDGPSSKPKASISASSRTRKDRPPSPSGLHLRFRDPRQFGGVWWLGREQTGDERMGPEPLTLSAGQLARRLSRTRRAIKSALLDQTLVAGLGNIYVDESLFASGIHPLQPANTLSPQQVGRLSRAIKTILNRAIRHHGSTLRDYVDAEGRAGAFQKIHRVYARADLPCRHCHTPIQRIVLGGRSTHFCPCCQPPTTSP